MKTEGLRGATTRRVSCAAVLATALALIAPGAVADTSDNDDFESFALGDPYGQNGWTALDLGGYNAANWDIDIVDPSAVWGSQLGTRALRISNAVTSGGFGNQLQSASLADEAGESGATASANAGGTRQSRLSGTITFASATQAYQPGMVFSFAPDSGDGTRMANFRITDEADGFRVEVITLDESIPNFVATTVASGLSHTAVHTLQFSLDFVDGDNNDVLWVKVDDVGCSTLVESGSWEQYHRYYAGNATPITFTADSILFRLSGTAVPANMGNGVLFDQFDLSSSTVAPMRAPGLAATPAAPVVTVAGQHVTVTDTQPTTNACQPITAYRATLTPTGGGTPIVLTSPSPQFDFATVPAGTYAATVAATNAAGTTAESESTQVVIQAAQEDPATEAGDDEELAESGPTLLPLALAALALVTAGLVTRRRAS